MEENTAITIVDRQDWLEPAADGLQRAVSTAFEDAGAAGREVKNFLHGTWLGHPLHPVLTDIPLGAWTAALVFDAIDDLNPREEFRAASDAAIAVGLAGAAGAALTGLTDWQALDGRARRLGLAHGLLNTAGALLYAGSLIARRNGARSTGRGLSALGFTLAAGSAWLGGHLVYREQVGVDHTAGQTYPEQFRAVLPDAELYEGQPRRVEVDGTRILLLRREGRVYAIAETCSHLGGPLSEGKFEDCAVTCPWHGSRFSLQDGRVLDGPAAHPQPAFQVRVRHEQIEIRLTPPER